MKVVYAVFFIFVILFVSLAVKGRPGNPLYYQKERNLDITGPFEVSNNSSRFALTEAIVSKKSLFLDHDLATFSSPDISKINNRYISIFTPGISFLGIPFYYLGNFLGIPQLLTYLFSSIVAVLNVYLIAKAATKLGLNMRFGLFSGLLYLFATNAFSYSNSFTQHHISVALILLAILYALSESNFMNNVKLGLILGLGVIVDIPNIFLMAPIYIYVFFKHISIKDELSKISLGIKLSFIGVIIGLIPFLSLFGWYNYQVSGSVTTLGQTYGRAIYPDSTLTDDDRQKEEKTGFNKDFHQFDTRRVASGLEVLLVSTDRGIIVYSPILIFGILGLLLLYKKNEKSIFNILISVILVNIILYSLFNDPWGGWAFGPRYLIPATAILSIMAGLAIQQYKKNIYFNLCLFIIIAYSIFINTLGALTTQQVPSSIQAIHLSEKIPSNFIYNITLLNKGLSSSLIYNTFLRDKVNITFFVYLVSILIYLFFLTYYFALVFRHKEKNNDK